MRGDPIYGLGAMGPTLAALMLLAGCPSEPPSVGGGSGGEATGSTAEPDPTDPDSTGDGREQTPACRDYMACLAEALPEQIPIDEPRYGASGSCWADLTMAADCTITCASRTESLCPNSATAGGTGDELPACSIDAVLPGARSPVEVGDGPEQLPVEIGELVERNCGCHFVDNDAIDPEVPAYFGALSLATWPDFHSPFMGQPTWQRVRNRAIDELNMPPTYYCGDLDFGSLTAADHVLFRDWLDASAPDAATWNGR